MEFECHVSGIVDHFDRIKLSFVIDAEGIISSLYVPKTLYEKNTRKFTIGDKISIRII